MIEDGKAMHMTADPTYTSLAIREVAGSEQQSGKRTRKHHDSNSSIEKCNPNGEKATSKGGGKSASKETSRRDTVNANDTLDLTSGFQVDTMGRVFDGRRGTQVSTIIRNGAQGRMAIEASTTKVPDSTVAVNMCKDSARLSPVDSKCSGAGSTSHILSLYKSARVANGDMRKNDGLQSNMTKQTEYYKGPIIVDFTDMDLNQTQTNTDNITEYQSLVPVSDNNRTSFATFKHRWTKLAHGFAQGAMRAIKWKSDDSVDMLNSVVVDDDSHLGQLSEADKCKAKKKAADNFIKNQKDPIRQMNIKDQIMYRKQWIAVLVILIFMALIYILLRK